MNDESTTKERTETNTNTNTDTDDVRHYTCEKFEQYYLGLNEPPPPEPQQLNFLF